MTQPEPGRMQHLVEDEVHRDVAWRPGSGRRAADCPGSEQSSPESRLLCNWTSQNPARRRDRAAERTPPQQEASSDGRSGECLACSTTAGRSLGHPGGDNKPRHIRCSHNIVRCSFDFTSRCLVPSFPHEVVHGSQCPATHSMSQLFRNWGLSGARPSFAIQT